MPGHGRIAHSQITRKFRLNDRQLLFARGSGGIVWDADGNSYVDFVMGYGPVILGHAVETFNTQLHNYLANGVMLPGYTVFHEEYLDRLLADVPERRAAVFKTGSEAVTAALRLAALETGRLGVVRSGYVGWHDAQIAHSLKWHEPLHSPLRNQPRYTTGMRGVGPDEVVLNWVDLRLRSLADVLDQHDGDIGAFVFDAYLASMTTPDVIAAALTLCRDAGVLTVFDETKTGGRVSRLGYAHDHSLDADLVVIGKALANGAPISLLVGGPDLLARAEQQRLSGTFSKELLAAYAALATLATMEAPTASAPDGWRAVAEIGRNVADVLTRAAKSAGVAALVWAHPVLGGGMFELVYSDALLGDREGRASLRDCFAEAGIILLEGHPSFVCLAHAELDWDRLEEQAHMAFALWAGRREVAGA